MIRASPSNSRCSVFRSILVILVVMMIMLLHDFIISTVFDTFLKVLNVRWLRNLVEDADQMTAQFVECCGHLHLVGPPALINDSPRI